MIYYLRADGRIGLIGKPPPITCEEVGALIADRDEPHYALVTCQVVRIMGQQFQMFYRSGHDGPVNQAASNINRSAGDDECIHGDVVMLSGPHMIDYDDIPDEGKWGHA